MSEYAHHRSLVNFTWLDAHRNDPKVKLVEVDVDTTAYDSGHIPGALAFNWQTELQDTLRRDVASPEAFARLLGAAGIDDGTTVVLYGDHENWFAAYAFWLLRYYGHRDVKLLDGGRKKWIAEGRPFTTERPRVEATTYAIRDADPSLRAYRDQVLSIVQRGARKAALVDVRSEAEYRGEILAPPGLPETAQRAGHIPGAVNVPWSRAVREDGTFLNIEELRAIYESLGVTRESPVITYCRIGERSSHTWFVLSELLGYSNVRNYDGSWTEWGSLIGVPVERAAALAERTAVAA
jgi:thiosulfate/3-mercaptopyruvate sulfurtransferase